MILSGSCGAGKTAVGYAVHELLNSRQVPNAFLDVDELSHFWPPVGRFNERLALDSLGRLLPLYRKFGAARLVLARVIERREDLAAYSEVLDGSEITLVRITADETVRKARLTAREVGDSLDWHVARTVELEAILEAAALEDHLVRNEREGTDVVAREVLERCGWIA